MGDAAVVYLSAARVDDVRQLDRQREACESYATRSGLQVVDEVVDRGPGSQLRPGLARLLDDLEDPDRQWSAVVVHRLDRLSRSGEIVSQVVSALDRRMVRLHVVG